MPHLPHRLILASSSRYRRELLARLRLPFEAISPDIDETPAPGEAPADLALRLSVDKALAIAGRHPGCIVIGSDQVATVDGRPIGRTDENTSALQQLMRHT